MTRFTCLSVAIHVLGATLAGQVGPYHSETPLVVLHATVQDPRGEVVTNLPQSAFVVRENGKRQAIALFRRDDVPVSIGILLDNSRSMRDKRAKVEAAALALVRASNPQDEVFLLNFADKARVDVPFTSDIHMLEEGIGRVDSVGGTAMRDGVALAERYLADRAARDRKVLLIVTDGNDNESLASEDHIRTTAQQAGVVIYAIGLLNDQNPSQAARARHDLTRLTAATGGVASYPTSLDQIDGAALELAREIRNQYTLAYTPSDQALDNSYRRIEVTVKGPEKLTVRTRAGYWARAGATAGATPQDGLRSKE